jgi:L-tyrosine isonitrile synthase
MTSTLETSSRTTAELILHILLKHHRFEGEHDHGIDEYPSCFSAQLDQIEQFINVGEPLKLALPGFPCKSPNCEKVLSHLPDMGERLALRFLHKLCKDIEEVYSPGARVLICSDGHVFGDLILVPDIHIDEYAAALQQIIDDEGMDTIELFSLEHVFGGRSYDDKRAKLATEFGESLDDLRDRVREDASTLSLYRGITRFLLEDSRTPHYEGSKAALLRASRKRAYGVIQRSKAWGELINRFHPKTVRLSIHPQPCKSDKLGIALLEADDAWTTPWHSVVLQNPDGTVKLEKRSIAQRRGRLVDVDGRPSHYVVCC